MPHSKPVEQHVRGNMQSSATPKRLPEKMKVIGLQPKFFDLIRSYPILPMWQGEGSHK